MAEKETIRTIYVDPEHAARVAQEMRQRQIEEMTKKTDDIPSSPTGKTFQVLYPDLSRVREAVRRNHAALNREMDKRILEPTQYFARSR